MLLCTLFSRRAWWNEVVGRVQIRPKSYGGGPQTLFGMSVGSGDVLGKNYSNYARVRVRRRDAVASAASSSPTTIRVQLCVACVPQTIDEIRFTHSTPRANSDSDGGEQSADAAVIESRCSWIAMGGKKNRKYICIITRVVVTVTHTRTYNMYLYI